MTAAKSRVSLLDVYAMPYKAGHFDVVVSHVKSVDLIFWIY